MTSEDHSTEDPEKLAAASEATSADDLHSQAVEEAEAVVLEAEAISRRMVEEARLEAKLMLVAARDDEDPETSPGTRTGDQTTGKSDDGHHVAHFSYAHNSLPKFVHVFQMDGPSALPRWHDNSIHNA